MPPSFQDHRTVCQASATQRAPSFPHAITISTFPQCAGQALSQPAIVINPTTQGDMLKIKQLRAEINSLEASQGSTWDSISAPCRGRWVEHSLSFAFAQQDPPPTTETASALHLRLRFGLGSLKPDKSQLHLAALIFSNRAFRLICHFLATHVATKTRHLASSHYGIKNKTE